MSARAISTATISFGLVSIPVKLYAATSPQSSIGFNLLHKKCGCRLKQQYICPQDNEVVGRDDMQKGYEYAKGQYVTFTEEELARLEAVATEAIEITDFVPIERVDPVFFEKPYYLGPDKGGDKAYHLLAATMRTTGRAAVAKYAARGKQYLVLLRPVERGLVMQQLRYADEVRPFADVPMSDPIEPKEAELRLATQLVDQISSDVFRPEGYEDEVKKRTQALIEQKIAGKEVTAAPPEQPRGQIIDLLEALKASLDKAPAARPEPARAPAADAVDEAVSAANAAGRKGPKRAPEGEAAPRRTKKVS